MGPALSSPLPPFDLAPLEVIEAAKGLFPVGGSTEGLDTHSNESPTCSGANRHGSGLAGSEVDGEIPAAAVTRRSGENITLDTDILRDAGFFGRGSDPAMPSLESLDSLPAEKGRAGLRVVLIALDLVGGFVAWSIVLTHTRHPTPHATMSALVLAVLTSILIAVHRLYLARVCAVRSVEVGRLATSSLVTAFAATIYHEMGGLGPSPTAAILGAGLTFFLLASLRTAYSAALRTCRTKGMFCRPICILGTNEEAEFLVDLIESEPEMGYRVVGVIGDRDEWWERGMDIPLLGSTDDPVRAARESSASSILIATSAIEQTDLDRVVRNLLGSGLHVQISSGLTRIGHQRVRANPLSHQLLFYVERSGLSSSQRFLKRCLDVTVAGSMLILSAPLIAVAAVAIKLQDGGSVFYRQERIGWRNEPFQLIKLRTMVPDASAQMDKLAGMNERCGPLFKLSHDPRVTRVGRLLRGTSLDELPQLINVLKGEMSLVGPRPALASEVAKFDTELLERTSVFPGITGLWQVEARDSPSFYTYRRLDLFYVDNWSVMLDVTILCATLVSVGMRGLRALRGSGETIDLTTAAKIESPPFDRWPTVAPAAPEM